MQRYNKFLKPQYFFPKKITKLTFFDVSQQIVCVHKHLLTQTKCLLTQRKHLPASSLSSAGINKERSQDALPANLGTPHIYLPIYNKVEISPIYNKV